MPDFTYRAKKGPEKIVEGVVEATTETVAIEKIHRMGYIPIHVHLAGGSYSRRASLFIFSGKKRKIQLIFFSQYLARFLDNGMSILRSLNILCDQQKDPEFHDALSSMMIQVRSGKSLSKAMESYPRYFSSLYISTIRAGERGGRLPECLRRLSEYLKKLDAVRTRVQQAMTYPTLLAVAGMGTIYYIVTYVVPKLAGVFDSMGQQLPLPTQLVINLGTFMNQYWILALFLPLLFLTALFQFFNRPMGKRFVDTMSLRLPLIGSFIFRIDFSRFCRTMEMSVSSGLSFLESIKMSMPTLSNSVLKNAVLGCYHRVQKGESFGRSLRSVPEVPFFVSDLIIVGEESGKVDYTFSELADVFEKETDEQIHFFVNLLEPLMILFVGGAVGFIVIAMLLPIFEINVMVS